MKKIERISLDPASLTSAHLLQILFAEFHELAPRYISVNAAANHELAADADEISDSGENDCDAQLLIGNQAIDFRLANGDRFHYLDLGAEWLRCTGLPFVYAVWMMNPAVANSTNVANHHLIADELRAIKADGLAHLDEIAVSGDFVTSVESSNSKMAVSGEKSSTGTPRYSPEFRRRYLGGHIRYELGDREKTGLALFRELLIKHRHIPANHEPPRFV